MSEELIKIAMAGMKLYCDWHVNICMRSIKYRSLYCMDSSSNGVLDIPKPESDHC